ncbi:zinc finger Y-chromosomal protein 2-like [Tribolium madens]|uniref:zinc finger Y-chromosomal protein 2-like n=1 Tax=Tribolium madens TaxID=41895 RepID=UPI001CF74CEE|nr:zinc finger Y-chromosomal protein 2-like [Tribolium madens]
MLDKRKSTCDQTPETLQCKLCNFKIEFKIILHYHVKNLHKNLHKNKETRKEIVKYKCNKCNFATYSILLWYKLNVRKNVEIKEFTKVYTYEYTYCPFKTVQKVTLKYHIISRHTPYEEIKWLHCSQCVFKTKSKSSLLKHTSVIHENTDDLRSLSCDLCNYRTQQKKNLKRHKNYNHSSPQDTVWLNCTKCEYKTKHRVKWLHCPKYLKKVKTEELYEYTECSFKSGHTIVLKCHMIRQHATPHDAEWYNCAHCSYRSKTRSNTLSHIRLKHTKETPENQTGTYFTCNFCFFSNILLS